MPPPPPDVSAARLSDGSVSLRLGVGSGSGVETTLVLSHPVAEEVAHQILDALGADALRQPNDASRRALGEDEETMPTFDSPDALFADLDA
jgi:hypothetical protein